MNKCIILIYLGLVIVLSGLASSVPIPHGNFTYVPNSGGWMDIYNQGQLFSRFGFAVSGTIGGNEFIRTSANYTWNTQNVGSSFIARNNNPNANWTANFTIKPNNDLKITHTLINNVAAVSNTKFWYIQTVNANQSVSWNGTQYYLNQSRNIQGNLANIVANINFFDGYAFNYNDLIADNFTITNFYVGDGSLIGFPNTWLLAIGVTKNNGVFPLGATAILDPSVISGCTETSTTIECHSGSFSGNTLDTAKNISIYSATITTTQTDNPTCGTPTELAEGYISLNSSGGWINISNSYINANSTETILKNKCSSFHIRNSPQGLIIESSNISTQGGRSSCGGDDGACATGGDSHMAINPIESANITIWNSRFYSKGGFANGGDLNDVLQAGSSVFEITSSELVFRGGSSLFYLQGGDSDQGGTSRAGHTTCNYNSNNITTIDTFVNVSCDGGDATGTGTRIDGNSNLNFRSKYVLYNGTIIQTTQTDGNPDTAFTIKNTSFTDGQYFFRGGRIDSAGQDLETHDIHLQELTLQDFSFKVGIDAGSIFNITQDVARIGQFGTSTIVNTIPITTYGGSFGMFVVGNSTAGFSGFNFDYDTHSLSEYYAPLTNFTFVNNTMVAGTHTFTGNTISNNTLANATLYVWNSTGSLISSNTTQILSGQSSAISISHTFAEGQDVNNNYTVNLFVRDTGNSGSFMNRGNRSLNVDFVFPNISLANLVETLGSQTVTFNLSAEGQQGCYYSVYTEDGEVSGLNNNITITCGTTTSATAGGFGQFRLYGYANDSVGNLNSTNLNLSLQSSGGGGSSGASTGGGIKIIGQTVNWTIQTNTGQSSYSLLVKKGQNKTRAIQFINDAPTQVQIELSCTGSYCPLVSFENNKFSLPASTVNKVTEVDFTFSIPEDIEVNEFAFILLATDQEGNIAELPVSASISPLASLSEFFDKMFSLKRISGIDIPLLVIGAFGAFITFGITYFGPLRPIKTKGTRGFISVFPSFLVFILIIIFIS